MSIAATIQFRLREWTPRARLYAAAVLLTLGYLSLGWASYDNPRWVLVHLPLSAASFLLLGLSASETYLYVRRMQCRQVELEASRVREQELLQHLATQREHVLQEISRVLIDKLDINQLPREVLEKIADMFAADHVAIWVAQKGIPGTFCLRGIVGITDHTPEQLGQIRWTFPCYGCTVDLLHQIITGEVPAEVSPMLASFAQRERVQTAVLNPIVRRNELVGVIGVFYRERFVISPWLGAEMQTLAHLLASAVQAEELYRDLLQVQKVESIGTLASGIAHDFNNVLAAILACASYVKQHTDPSNPSYRYLEAAEASAHRGAALTKQVLAFARREGPRQVVLQANESIEQTLKMLERSFDKSILVQRQLAPDLAFVEADPSQLEQIILNISVNARDAMSDGGIFTISSRNVRLDMADRYRPKIELPDGDYVVLGFRDMGHGMDEATQKRIFEPFFTTKAPGKGTGLGLSVVLGIVRGFGGDIRVESSPGRGTLFEVFLPATTKSLPAAMAETPVADEGGRECILLVEDEDIIREMAQLSLEAKGYRVLTAADGASALACYRQEASSIDLVIADMAMPRMGGPELIAHLRGINAGVRVVVTSGYSHDLEGQKMLQQGCLAYLQKPYNADALNRLVRSVLDSGL